MKWIDVWKTDEIPKDKTLIVEDCNGWMGQAYFEDGKWILETFDQSFNKIKFDKIRRYIVIE